MLNYTNRNLVLKHFEDYFQIYKYKKVPQVFYQDEHHYIYKNQFLTCYFSKNYLPLDLYELQLLRNKVKKCYLITKEQFSNMDVNHILIENKFPSSKYLFAYYKDYLVLNPYNKNFIADIRLKPFRDLKKDEFLDDYTHEKINFNVTQQVMFFSIFKMSNWTNSQICKVINNAN